MKKSERIAALEARVSALERLASSLLTRPVQVMEQRPLPITPAPPYIVRVGPETGQSIHIPPFGEIETAVRRLEEAKTVSQETMRLEVTV